MALSEIQTIRLAILDLELGIQEQIMETPERRMVILDLELVIQEQIMAIQEHPMEILDLVENQGLTMEILVHLITGHRIEVMETPMAVDGIKKQNK
jgi:hypothetical protein